jgi:hypothetical protein
VTLDAVRSQIKLYRRLNTQVSFNVTRRTRGFYGARAMFTINGLPASCWQLAGASGLPQRNGELEAMIIQSPLHKQATGRLQC